MLLNWWADKDKETSDGDTSLILASDWWYAQIVRLLTEAEVDLDVTTVNWETAIYKAVNNNHIEVVKVLLNAWVDIDIVPGWEERTLIEIAEENESPDIYSLLLTYE
jgi:ankyrin repeat protein